MNFIDTGLQFDDENFEGRLAALPVPAMPADLALRCRRLVASGVKPVGAGRHRSGQLVLLGAAVMAAAAAAALFRQFDQPAESPVDPVPVSQDAPTQRDQPVPPVVKSSGPTRTASTGEPAPIAQVSTSFSVRVLPLKNEARSAEARSRIEIFHASFLRGLRDIPGLTLITPESTGIADGTVAPYQLEFKATDANSPSDWNVLITAKALVAGSTKSTVMTLPILIRGGDGDPAGMAIAQVDLVRNVLFPQDALRKQQLQSRLLDRTLDPSVRLRALTDLRLPRLVAPEGERVGRIQNSSLEESVIPAAVDLANASDPKLRASTWRALRGVGNPSLVTPLVQAARHDESEEVRLLAMTMLAGEFPANPAAAAALQVAATDEPHQLVRMVAQKAVAGGAAGDRIWRDYVLATVRDANLDASLRLEPLSYMAASGLPVASVLDDEMVSSLAPLFGSIWSGGIELDNLGRSLAAALQASGNPAALDLYLEALRVGKTPMTRSVAVRTLAEKFSSDERARTALESVAASDPDPALRLKAADALGASATPPPGT